MSKMLALLPFLTIVLLDVIQAQNPVLKQCYDRMKTNNITAKPITFSQLLAVGKVYGNEYCAVGRTTPENPKCISENFLDSNNTNCYTGYLASSVALGGMGLNYVSDVHQSSIPGVFEAYEQMTLSNARLIAVLDATPGKLVMWLCSVDVFQFNDFRLYTAEKELSETNARTELSPYVTTQCNYFPISQSGCPTTSISLTRTFVTSLVERIEGSLVGDDANPNLFTSIFNLGDIL